MLSVLNPDLCDRLCRVFGGVSVANAREPYQAVILADAGTGRPRDVPQSCGEYYRVTCFAFSDTRRRLWINHRWPGVPYLVHCFNEQCMSGKDGRANRQLLQLKVYGNRHPPAPPRPSAPGVWGTAPQPAAIVSPAPPAVELPTGLVPLNALPAHHPALQYVVDRGFDSVALSRNYEVSVCEAPGPGDPYLLRMRLILPVRRHGTLATWQARRTYELPREYDRGDPKYYTARTAHRGSALYGMDAALGSGLDLVVVCEGPTDVWRVGPPAAPCCRRRRRRLSGSSCCITGAAGCWW
jgi:hypothetical protein